MTEKNAARLDWEQRIGLPSDQPLTGTSDLPAPTGLRSEDGTGHVLLDWQPVEGALGYLVHRADTVRRPVRAARPPRRRRARGALTRPTPTPWSSPARATGTRSPPGRTPAPARSTASPCAAARRRPDRSRAAVSRLGRRLRRARPTPARLEPDDRRRAPVDADPGRAGAGRRGRRQGVRRRAGHRARRARRAHGTGTRHVPARVRERTRRTAPSTSPAWTRSTTASWRPASSPSSNSPSCPRSWRSTPTTRSSSTRASPRCPAAGSAGASCAAR